MAHGAQPRNSTLPDLRPLDISCTPIAYDKSGLRFIPQSTLQGWQSQLKGLSKPDDDRFVNQDSSTSDFALDDFNTEIEDGILRPTLSDIYDPRHGCMTADLGFP